MYRVKYFNIQNGSENILEYETFRADFSRDIRKKYRVKIIGKIFSKMHVRVCAR